MKPSTLIRTLLAAGALCCATGVMAQPAGTAPPPAPTPAPAPGAAPAAAPRPAAEPPKPEVLDPAAEAERKKAEAAQREKMEQARKKAELDNRCVIKQAMSDAEIAKCR
ncbi:MAG: hypothetical protein HZA62_06390 [Rhodocyclales bacterium]|nr:hypothetical protein [Rhodocyclales bacterium]